MLSEDEKETLSARLRQFKYAKELYLLNQFRRHPDWSAALSRVLKSRRDFYIEFEKDCWGIPEYNFPAIEDAVDQEFIDEIIRNEAREKAI